MTRINKTTNFFNPQTLQPSGFFDQGRKRAFAGNHPAEPYKRVHFIRTNDINGGTDDLEIDKHIQTLNNSIAHENVRAIAASKLCDYYDTNKPHNDNYNKKILDALVKACSNKCEMIRTGAALSLYTLAVNEVNLDDYNYSLSTALVNEAGKLSLFGVFCSYALLCNHMRKGLSANPKTMEKLEKCTTKITENVNGILKDLNSSEIQKEENSFYLYCLSGIKRILPVASDGIKSGIESSNSFIALNCLTAIYKQPMPEILEFADSLVKNFNSYIEDIKLFALMIFEKFNSEIPQEAIPLVAKTLKTNDTEAQIISLSILLIAKISGLDISAATETLTEISRSKDHNLSERAKEILDG